MLEEMTEETKRYWTTVSGNWFLVAGSDPGVIVDTHYGTLNEVMAKARILAKKHKAAIWAILGEPTGVLAWPRVAAEKPVYLVGEDEACELQAGGRS